MKLQPTPAQAMALLASGLLEVDGFPDVAAQWLADGMDSESLRMLAGANHEDRDDIRDLWTAALEELDIQPILAVTGLDGPGRTVIFGPTS